jgi:serine/threonine protein kinase
MEQNGPISQDLMLNWLKQLLLLLEKIHEQHFIHRDIKPSNIILQPSGRLALIDFGTVQVITPKILAKIGASFNTEDIWEYETTIVGTPGYIPQEQVNGKAVPQSDFYALGITLIELMVGFRSSRLPRDEISGKLLWRRQATQINPYAAKVIDWLIEPVPGDRPQNAQLIQQYLNGSFFQTLLVRNRLIKSRLFQAGMLVTAALLLGGSYLGVVRGASWIYFIEGLKAQDAGRLEQAKSDYEQALKFNPQYADALSNLSQVCEDLKDEVCTEDSYRRLFEINPNSAEGRYNLGSYYDGQGVQFDPTAGKTILDSKQIEKAIAQYQQAIAPDGNIGVNALNNLARLRIFQQDYKNAESIAREGLTKTADPEILSALNKNLGWALFKQNRLDEALTVLKTATTLDPYRKEAFCLQGLVLDADGKAKDSEQAWQECFSTQSKEEIAPEVLEWRHQKLQQLLHDKLPSDPSKDETS